MSEDVGEVTILLRAMNCGDKAAGERLLHLVYDELHRLAKSYMRRERPDHTLQPTALINEAYLRLVGADTDWKNQAHFIGTAANVMRRVLVDYARTRNAAIRGGDLKKIELEEGLAFSKEKAAELLDLDAALDQLQKINPRQARVVELRYFGGLSVEEIAVLLSIGVRSVERDWSLARTWLFDRVR